jgi:hypothetical protein
MLDLLQSSPLFSVRRLVVGLLLTGFVLLTDVLFINLMGIATITEALTELTIHTLGWYGGLTIAALFNQPGSGDYY